MDKKLPSMYQNNINKTLTNSMKTYYSNKYYTKPNNTKYEEKKEDITKPKYEISVKKKIYNIFKNNKYKYVIDVKVVYKDRQEDIKLIGQDNRNIITYDKNKIRIDDIIDIYEI